MENTNYNNNNNNNNNNIISDNRPSRDKRKRRSGHQHQHHPWDEEVSLPGAVTGESENSTIFKVLNKPNTSEVVENIDAKGADRESEKTEKHLVKGPDEVTDSPKDEIVVDVIETDTNKEPQSTVASSGDEHIIGSESLVDSGFSAIDNRTESFDSSNVLDIESHLIETYDEYLDNEDSVGINELSPAQHELSIGSSKIETDTIVRTVIEVEPAGVQTKKPIETIIQVDKLKAKLADSIDGKETSTTAAIGDLLEVSEDIKRAAEILVRKIECEALEAVRKQVENPSANDEERFVHINEHDKTERVQIGLLPEEVAAEESSTLSQRVDEQLSEVTSILKKNSNKSNSTDTSVLNGTLPCDQIKLVDVPSPKTALEAEERKLFIDSLPQIYTGESNSDAQKLAIDCKREYYQSLKKYLIQHTADKPPVPLQTYRWEDLKRARERGGYPWTHLYKRPLGPDEEPEIVLLLRKSQELRFASESPKSLKKVRIDDQVHIKETERYIQELSEDEENIDEHRHTQGDEEDHLHDLSHTSEDLESQSIHSECISCVSDSVLATGKPRKPYLRLANIRAIIKRRRSARSNEDAQSLPGTLDAKDLKQPKVPRIQLESTENQNSEVKPHKTPRCFDIMKKLKSMADRQKKRLHIKRIPLKKDERIVLNDETKILKLKKSPKSERSEIPHFIEKQDSDDVLEIVELDESPSRKRKDESPLADVTAATSSIVQPDEVINIADFPVQKIEVDTTDNHDIDVTVNEKTEPTNTAPPKKAPRLRREHVYEEITHSEPDLAVTQTDVLPIGTSVAALKESLQKQDTNALNELENVTKPIPLDRMGSSEEEAISITTEKSGHHISSTLAPLSSIDSASSDDERSRPHLSPVSEESDAASTDYHINENEIPRVIEETEHTDLKPSIKKEASPAPSDKKVVTFSHVEDEAEPHREDIELPEHILEASAAQKKTKTMRSASVGALPREKKHFVSRNESASGVSLEVRCACQFFESESLLPERVNPPESRPTSNVGFHTDIESINDHLQIDFGSPGIHDENFQSHQDILRQPSPLLSEVISTRSFNVAGHTNSMDYDRFSVHSGGGHRTSTEHIVPPVDLTFVEKYPELEETARSRGLVVGNIGAIDQPISSSTFLAGMRGRQMSTGAISIGMRDPDAISIRSGVSVRRISRSPSKTDLFVADLNIPTLQPSHGGQQREQRSVSVSRRSSNLDLYHTGYQPMNLPHIGTLHQQSADANYSRNTSSLVETQQKIQRTVSPQRSPSPQTTDFRSAKLPMSADYMRPSENKENMSYYNPSGELPPQNRPIDISKYDNFDNDDRSFNTTSPNISHNSHIASTAAFKYQQNIHDPLQETVAVLEEIATTSNIENISDRINLETRRPSSNIGDIRAPSLHLDEEIKINIIREVPIVDIAQLVQNENEKAKEEHIRSSRPSSRQQSPIRKRQLSPSPRRENMDLLQLPNVNNNRSSSDSNQAQTHTPIKRQRSAERQSSPTRFQQSENIQIDGNFMGQEPPSRSTTPMREISPEKKSSYSFRFKSMFNHNKKSNDSKNQANGTTLSRKKSPSPSPTPKREKSTSPKPKSKKLLSMLTKPQPTAVEMVSGSSTAITKDQKTEPLAVRVTETFSLKVDEMDQYSTRAPKPSLLSASYTDTPTRSREDIQTNEHSTSDLAEAFVPVVVGNKSPYSSETDVKFRRSEMMLNRTSREQSSTSQFSLAPKGQLFSAPIQIGDSREMSVDSQGRPFNYVDQNQPIRFPSQVRSELTASKLVRKSSFLDGRTQSQDRTRHGGSHDNLFEARISKTVSFNFGERKSRLSDFENMVSQKEREKRDFLESTYFKRDHEYEPIGVPSNEGAPSVQETAEKNIAAEIETIRDEMKEAEELQKDLEDRYFSSEATTPKVESRNDHEIHTSQVDSSALEELSIKPESHKKSFMASAQDRTRKMQAGFKNQAGKIKTKFRSSTKKSPSGSPKAKERRRFKAPEFSKIKIPEIKRPDISKFKEFKRPEFTKFNKPDMSKFKLPEKFSTLKLHRSKSLKENEVPKNDTEQDGAKPHTAEGAEGGAEPHKKLFEFNFGTYPRAFRKKKKPLEHVESSFGTGSATEGPSVIPSTDTQPSFESSSSPQGDRGPGPVRSRWADKFSDVSYNDSEGSRYRRYGSEQESFDRESSLERRMKDDLEDTGSEAPEMGIISRTAENKEFAEFDEENRAIHEISNLRAGEFRRRPIVHQDSDLRSEDSRDAVGWTDKEIQKIKLLRRAELEAEASFLKFASETHETISTASSGKKVVMEEIDDDEFFLRKRGVSEDNIDLRQYISKAIREGYDTPTNTLEYVGKTSHPIEYPDYDVPPPKPRRLHKSFRPEDASQDLGSLRSDYGDDLSMSQNGSDFFGAPKRPMRKGRSHSKYSMDSQDMPPISGDDEDLVRRDRYFDDDEEYLRPPQHTKTEIMAMNNLDFGGKQDLEEPEKSTNFEKLPQAPRRRKRHLRDTSIEKDPFLNSMSGRSVSNSYLQPTEDVIVYRTEHEYYKPPLATPENYTDGTSTPSHKSRLDDEDHTSGLADPMGSDIHYRFKYEDEAELDSRGENDSLTNTNASEKFVIDMIENDGYAVVRKEQLPKPTPPARRKKFTRSPGERFATLPNAATQIGTPPPARPPPPRGYIPLDYHQDGHQKDDEDDYEEPELLESERPESPRDLQSGEIINKMKFRPLPPPPRPPREKRQRSESKLSAHDYDEESEGNTDHLGIDEHKRLAVISSDESYAPSEELSHLQEVEVSTQTDPLPDDFVCEEFEITEDMRIIEPRRRTSPKTLEDLLKEEQIEGNSQMTEDEQLARGLQRFRDANQRSLSERSRASSQADRSKSLSRPQTPSAIIIERRVSTPVPSHHENETMLEASLIVRPIDDLDLEEEALRREGLLTDSSQQSKSDVEENQANEASEEEITKYEMRETSYTPSFSELEKAVENLRTLNESEQSAKEKEKELEDEGDIDDIILSERTMRDYGYNDKEKEEDVDQYSKEYNEEKEYSGYEQQDLSQDVDQYSKEYDEEKEYSGYEQQDLSQDVVKEPEDRTYPEDEKRLDQAIEDIIEKHIRGDYTEDQHDSDHYDEPVPPPQPPPRRKSAVGVEHSHEPELTIDEDKIVSEKITPTQESQANLERKVELPNYVADLEVERLRVRALQAGQIMVSQLHGGQISAEELECKSGNLVVKGLELPAGFIEDIVDRVRNTDRGPLFMTETQTTLQTSSEFLPIEQSGGLPQAVPPPKPPRLRDLDHIEKYRNDEETQTESQEPPPVFTTTEYLETLVPLLRKDLEKRRDDESNKLEDGVSKDQHHRPHHHHHRHHHHHYRRCSSSSSDINDDDIETKEFDADGNYRASSSLSHRQHSRSRSRTRPPSECPSQSVSQAGRQFISACSLSLVSIIDQLTACVRGTDANKDQDPVVADARQRQVPALVVLFLIITFGVLLFLLSGRNVHTHHWDFFNPPGNEGRPT